MNSPPLYKRLLILAGGTGGHIIPGIALAGEWKRQTPAAVDSVAILSSQRNREFADFRDLDVPLHFYDPPRITLHPLRLVRFLFLLLTAYRKARRLMKAEGIAAVVGMGGYTSLPALLAARSLKIRIFLCEQNAIPGRATRLFSRQAKRIYLGIPLAESRYRLPEEKCAVFGNPLKPGLLDFAAQTPSDALSQNPRPDSKKKFTILVLGGSQGAKQLNEMCAEILRDDILQKLAPKKGPLPKIRWHIQCGNSHLAEMQRALPKDRFRHLELFGYHPSIAELFDSADLLICRSGAGVLGEACLFGLPMILVPYPYSQDGHQLANARYYESQNAAFVIDSKAVESRLLAESIHRILTDRELRSRMSKSSRLLARPDAARKITQDIISQMES